MSDGRRVLVPLLAQQLKREGIAEVDASEERRRFWQRALTPEQEQALWLQEMAARGIAELVPGSPEALDIGLGISKQTYPSRWDMLPGDGRDDRGSQAAWAWKHARKGPPEPTQEDMPAVPAQGQGDVY